MFGWCLVGRVLVMSCIVLLMFVWCACPVLLFSWCIGSVLVVRGSRMFTMVVSRFYVVSLSRAQSLCVYELCARMPIHLVRIARWRFNTLTLAVAARPRRMRWAVRSRPWRRSALVLF